MNVHDINNMDDLSLMLDRLAGEVAGIGAGEPSKVRGLQLIADELARAELALNDIERRAVR